MAEAGFEKIAQSIDHWGIFTVSIARRRAVTHMPQPPEARPWREAAGWLALLMAWRS